MWLSFLDESGNTGRKLDDPDQPIHWMAAVLVPEDKVLSLTLALDGVVAGIGGIPVETELHGAELFGGDGPWKGVNPAARVTAYEAALGLLAPNECVVAHSSIAKQRLAGSNSIATSPHVMAFQFLVEKLDRLAQQQADPLRQRLLLIADETDEHDSFQVDLINDMQRQAAGIGGGGMLTRVLDTVHFVDSKKSRGVQLADLVAYALNRNNRSRKKALPSRGDLAIQRMVEEHVHPVVRTYRSTWPS